MRSAFVQTLLISAAVVGINQNSLADPAIEPSGIAFDSVFGNPSTYITGTAANGTGTNLPGQNVEQIRFTTTRRSTNPSDFVDLAMFDYSQQNSITVSQTANSTATGLTIAIWSFDGTNYVPRAVFQPSPATSVNFTVPANVIPSGTLVISFSVSGVFPRNSLSQLIFTNGPADTLRIGADGSGGNLSSFGIIPTSGFTTAQIGEFDLQGLRAIPTPGSAALLALAGLAAARRRR